MKKVGIVLVNYKDYASKYLKACRDSLLLQSYQNFIVYLVDNASSEESVSNLQKIYPEAVILPREDGNYCAANNLGMKQGVIDGCDYLIAANMDTEFTVNWLLELVEALNNNSQAAIAQSLILLQPKTEDEKKNPQINTTGNLIHFLLFGFTNNYQVTLSKVNLDKYSEIKGYASGCSFIIRSEVFEEIGGYNENYYMYHDDLDISLKVKLAGYKIILAEKSLVYHKYEFERSVRMLYYMERNRGLTFFAIYPLTLIILLFPFWLVMSLGMLFFAVLGGWFKTKIKVMAYFLQINTWREIFKERKRYQTITKIKTKELFDNFVGKIEFQEIENPVLKYLVNPIFNAYWKVVKKIV